MASSEYIKELLQRYKKGTCTPQEIAMLEQWFEQVQHASEISSTLTKLDEERLVLRLIENPRFVTPVPAIDKSRTPGIFRRISRMAAAVWLGLLLCSGLATWLIYQNKFPEPPQHSLAFVEIKTTAGQLRRVVLPDSSVVWLNSLSSLSYHPDFSDHRELRLTGEAFFEVTHDKDHPFTVMAGTASTKVYGTAFNVQAYTSSSEMRVSLQQGSIGITYDSAMTDGEKMLSPGQLFIYDRTTNTVRISNENAEDIGGWVSGKLIFNQVPLKEVLKQLERRYNINCDYNSSLKNPLVTARFDNSPIEKIMNHLSFGWDIHFNRIGDTLYVK